MGLCAYMVLNNKGEHLAKKLMGGAIIFAVVTSLLEPIPFGHLQIVKVAETQKAKFATIEGVVKTTNDAPMLLFGIPDASSNTIKYSVEVPSMMKYMFLSPQGYNVTGLNDIPDVEKPPIVMPFLTFHLMVYLGGLLILISFVALFLLWTKKIFEKKWFLKLLVWAIPLPIIVIQLGWMVTEIGRQPWVIHGILKTADAVSYVGAGSILFSIVLIGLTEIICIVLWLALIIKTLKEGPEFKGSNL
jgi:cytochrome d ubiquinol oxidase subunit I